jgi:hypothetical protein
MSDFKSGDIVNIAIKGARVVRGDEDGLTVDLTPDGPSTQVYLPWGPELDVERVAPAEWPPRPGDLWRDANGMLYLGMQPFDDGRVEVVNVGGDYVEADELLHRKPTLVHREGEQDGEEPGEVAEPSAYGLDLARAVRESGGRS